MWALKLGRIELQRQAVEVVLHLFELLGTDNGDHGLSSLPQPGQSHLHWAAIARLDDGEDFLAYLGPLAQQTGKVRLVHGEPEQAWALADTLSDAGFADVDVPAREETVSIG